MATKKVKYTIEFPLKCPAHILYEFVGTATGLNEWFADKVEQQDKTFYFFWGSEPETAMLVEKKEDTYVRFRWSTMSKEEYFEFRIDRNDVTNGTVLLVTDFADANEVKDQQQLWDAQLHELKHRLGA
ncbi:MAG: hypothetical protein RL660_146 [Bacteroidota bacterium]|jgi:hypothetical protein